ncbi:hypothetical protein FJ364_02735 [Candidatus Dependentiae bacterium]|nr:hypothetical protein [Candidatus Dependentiae bacterium]
MRKAVFLLLLTSFCLSSSSYAMLPWLQRIGLWRQQLEQQNTSDLQCQKKPNVKPIKIKKRKRSEDNNDDDHDFVKRPRIIKAKVNFFQDITGVSEAVFRQNPRQYFQQLGKNHYALRNAQAGKDWDTGIFAVDTIAQLEAMIDEELVADIKTAGRFNVVVGFNTPNLSAENRRRLDVAALQADPNHNHAVFQVASNFDCREGQGGDVAAYAGSRAQGQTAAVSAAPGTIARIYAHGPIDLLEEVEELPAFGPRGLDLSQLSQADLLKAVNFDYDNMGIGIQQDTEVAFGFVQGNIHEECTAEDQRITQIYTSAVNLGLNNPRRFTPGSYARVEDIAKRVLVASYKGTILAAQVYGHQREGTHAKVRQEVFLTLMGCGVFGNEIDWVADALRSCMRDIVRYGLDVTLIVFDVGANPSPAMRNSLAQLRQLVNQTSGQFEEIR